MSEIYLTSDLHFFHSKTFIYEARGFSSVEEMNETIIEKYNSIVKPEDTVYILGDCVVGGGLEEGTELLKRLRGHKLLCIGNHDSDARLRYWMQNEIFEAYEFAYRFRKGKVGCYLTHFPTIVGNYDEPKWVNMFAHTHQSNNWTEETNNWQKANMYNVGVDAHNCYPVPLEEAIAKIKNQIKIEGRGYLE